MTGVWAASIGKHSARDMELAISLTIWETANQENEKMREWNNEFCRWCYHRPLSCDTFYFNTSTPLENVLPKIAGAFLESLVKTSDCTRGSHCRHPGIREYALSHDINRDL